MALCSGGERGGVAHEAVLYFSGRINRGYGFRLLSYLPDSGFANDSLAK